MTSNIPFNQPFIAGKELYYIAKAVALGNIGGDGYFTKQCARRLQELTGSQKVLMTPSCTAALEMAASLCNLQPGDEVICPSYTFVSTANAFVRLGARPAFVDIEPNSLNIDVTKIEAAITPRTRAIFPVHYAGIACEMDAIMDIADRHGLFVVEDAAQAVNATYRGKALGAIGHLGAYSFHETKNYICGEGGALLVNAPELIERAEILRDKGTNRAKFFRGEVDKYTWVDVGSSHVPSEICCAFLYAQLEQLNTISKRRRKIFQFYRRHLKSLEMEGYLRIPPTPADRGGNYHLFYILLPDVEVRDALMAHLKGIGIHSVFHYVPLHTSPMGAKFGYRPGDLPVTEDLSERLLRLPLFNDIHESEQARVTRAIDTFLRQQGVRVQSTRIAA